MRLGRVEATGGFFLLLAWLNYLDTQGLVPMAMAACALHELGHFLTLRRLGGRVRLIRLTAAGAALLLAGGVLSLGAGGNITLLLVALWLLAALFSQNNWGRNRNRACHRGGKQVK